jgi:hypothetical protein
MHPESATQTSQTIRSEESTPQSKLDAEARRRNAALIAGIENALPQAPAITKKQLKSLRPPPRKGRSAPKRSDLSKISFKVEGTEFTVWNTKEHLEFILSRLNQVPLPPRVKEKPAKRRRRQGFIRWLESKRWREARSRFMGWWREASVAERGKILPRLFTKPAVVKDKTKLRARIAYWFNEFVA